MQAEAKSKEALRESEYLDQLLSETEAARFLGFSVRTLQGWRVKGGGPRFVKIGGRSVRYRRRDLNAWADANMRLNTSQAAPNRP
jgi:excisionase family DNA binding protein